ncbi:MAG: glycosyltransferase family 2 protein [Lachnospiraceae bacterium]|nr:glycosyltransferase family 2 protein [Lachnospiraceae bacterium]
MEVTVIIPNYNGIQYLGDCLASIYQGTMVPEIIVVDNGSLDGSVELVERDYPQCELIRFQKNTGFCRAVNEGIKRAKTEFVLLLNNDIRVDKDFVHSLHAAIKSRKRAFSVAAKMLSMQEPEVIDAAGDLYCALGWAFSLGKGKRKERYDKSSEVFAACAGAAIYRRKIFETIGYFDENHFAYLEDVDIGYRARIWGYHNYYEPAALVYHAGSAVSGSRYNDFKVRLASRNSIYLIGKNMPLWQIILNLPLLIVGILIKALFFAKKGMGKTYICGIGEGIRLSVSRKGRQQKVPVCLNHMTNYFRIQAELWLNTIRRFTG